jgi:hypothetical protein
VDRIAPGSAAQRGTAVPIRTSGAADRPHGGQPVPLQPSAGAHDCAQYWVLRRWPARSMASAVSRRRTPDRAHARARGGAASADWSSSVIFPK